MDGELIIIQLEGATNPFAGLYTSNKSFNDCEEVFKEAEKHALAAEDEGDDINSAFDEFLSENGIIRIIAQPVKVNKIF